MTALSEIKLPAKMENLHEFLDRITEAAKGFGIADEKIGDIELACEEVVVNVINYAYVEHEGDISVICTSDGENKFVIEIVDSGIPFNVLEAEAPDLDMSLEDRQIGGLGIFFVKQLMDEVNYQRVDTKNVLTLTVYNQ
ncbi:ATP-binding protein [Candidatus Magnetomonas plexicatena]|uniref:ATP-binding protein n=1 Tax=Candidatus Magnetomonas plexicatena TaxID=2552947 RepID=UPI0011020527|nr:ATP-binding protein [Nitrospirales bacterium LBB_01]